MGCQISRPIIQSHNTHVVFKRFPSLQQLEKNITIQKENIISTFNPKYNL